MVWVKMLQEYLQLTGYILQRANVSSANANASLEDLINRWISSFVEYKWDLS